MTETVVITDENSSDVPESYLRYWNDIIPTLDLRFEWVIGFVGHRGGGKTVSSALLTAMDWLARMRPVRSNIPIRIPIFWEGKTYWFWARELDEEQLYTLDVSLQYGLVYIDEINFWADARRAMSNKNIRLGDFAQQLRKRHLSMIYTVQDEDWIDSRLRQQTDIIVFCNDIERTEWGMDEGMERGMMFSCVVLDVSGLLTGVQYKHSRESDTYMVHAKPFWNVCDSYHIVDVDMARQGLEIVMPKMRIEYGTDEKARKQEEAFHRAEAFLDEVRQDGSDLARFDGRTGQTLVRDFDIWNRLGVELNDLQTKRMIAHSLKLLGCTRRQKQAEWHYVLPEDV